MDISDDVSSILGNKGHQTWFVGPDATVFEAISFMADKNVGALLVMDDGDLVGIVSERDYTRKVILKDRSSHETCVREIMSTKVVAVQPSTTRHLPVLFDGRVVGVVSIGDLVERLIRSQRDALAQLEGYIVGRYPG